MHSFAAQFFGSGRRESSASLRPRIAAARSSAVRLIRSTRFSNGCFAYSSLVAIALQSRLHALAKVLGAEAKQAEGRDRHDIRSELDELGDARGVARRIAADTHELAAGPDSRNHLAHDLPHGGRTGIPHALPEVAGGDVQ